VEHPLVWTVAALSALALLAFGWDKACAVRGARRVPERGLLGLAVLGGWPGAWCGVLAFRHKTRKPLFLALLAAASLANAAALRLLW
jgi:uncharacterized membrane protein YsdA (DUF1294 family)